MNLEEDFDVEIPDQDALKLTTVRQIVEYVARKQAHGGADAYGNADGTR
jgi:acyl carrier protein